MQILTKCYLSIKAAVYGVNEIFILMYDSIIKVVSCYSCCVLLFDCIVVVRNDGPTIGEI